MFEKQDIPENVKEAKRWLGRVSLAIVAGSLFILPLVFASKAIGVDPLWAVGTWLGLGAVAGSMISWSKFSRAGALVTEFERHRAKNDLAILEDRGTSLAEAHPLHAIAARVCALVGDDERVSAMVDDLLARLKQVGQDVESLREAVATEKGFATSTEDPRVQRLVGVLEQKQALMAQLSGALRDIHVELTLRQNDDHEPLFCQVNDLLAGLSAEAEVARVTNDEDALQARRLQQMKAQKQRD
jgi:hypothetical protein